MWQILANSTGLAASSYTLLPCPAMKTVYDVRRENLRAMVKSWGGPTSLAKKLGHANGSYLAQLVGPNPRRDVSEKVAREIESKLGLTLGWMDQEHERQPGKLNDQALTEVVRAVATVLRDAGLRPDPETYGTLVQLAYDRAKLTGQVDESYIQKLSTLVRRSGKS
jgi:hypothetical protein